MVLTFWFYSQFRSEEIWLRLTESLTQFAEECLRTENEQIEWNEEIKFQTSFITHSHAHTHASALNLEQARDSIWYVRWWRLRLMASLHRNKCVCVRPRVAQLDWKEFVDLMSLTVHTVHRSSTWNLNEKSIDWCDYDEFYCHCRWDRWIRAFSTHTYLLIPVGDCIESAISTLTSRWHDRTSNKMSNFTCDHASISLLMNFSHPFYGIRK